MSDERTGAVGPADEEILAALGERPDDFALFYRRHVRGLLGYEAEPRIADGVTRQEPTIVWWSDRDDFGDASALAERLGADDLRQIDRRAPRPVFEAQGDLVVQVGTNSR
ncbi:MAG: hypothetical protein ABW060_13065 [Solirubrobacteraceae bacterium]